MVNRMTIDLRKEGSRNRSSAIFGPGPDIPLTKLVFGATRRGTTSKVTTHLMSMGTSEGTDTTQESACHV